MELIDINRALLAAVIAIAFMLPNVIIIMYMERKVMADMHIRYGPMRVGFHGLLQPIADFVKLVLKEEIIPRNADRGLHNIAPYLVFVPAFMVYLIIPIMDNVIARDLDIGIFWLFAITGILPVGVIIAGWASYNKYSLLGGIRAAAQELSYEVPLLLSVLGVILLVGSLSLNSIVQAQQGTWLGFIPKWFIFTQPIAFILYYMASLVEIARVPFDIPEAESELVQGFVTEYSGIKFAIFFLAEYSNLLVVSAIGALVFLGGWDGPAFLPPFAWLLIKIYALIYLNIWLRATLPRIRVDQLLSFGWKLLLPLALANVMVTALISQLLAEF